MTGGYVEVAIGADAELSEKLTGVLSQLGFEGFWEAEGSLRGYISAGRCTPALLDEIRSVVALVARSSSSPLPAMQVTPIADQNWNAEWEKTITPIRVTDRLIVTPSWHSLPEAPGEIVLTIDPKMSFGTGYHETTRLMLRLLEPRVREGMNVLDVGTGTGILAIAALRLGARHAVGCDVDPWSYENARENAAVNGVAGRCAILAGEIGATPEGPYDLVLANIQLNIIGPILGELKRRCAPGGALLLAGLLLQDEEEIRALLAQEKLEITERSVENEWLALAVRRGTP
jgi:ribosomal protein L11 methyltransferase